MSTEQLKSEKQDILVGSSKINIVEATSLTELNILRKICNLIKHIYFI